MQSYFCFVMCFFVRNRIFVSNIQNPCICKFVGWLPVTPASETWNRIKWNELSSQSEMSYVARSTSSGFAWEHLHQWIMWKNSKGRFLISTWSSRCAHMRSYLCEFVYTHYTKHTWTEELGLILVKSCGFDFGHYKYKTEKKEGGKRGRGNLAPFPTQAFVRWNSLSIVCRIQL